MKWYDKLFGWLYAGGETSLFIKGALVFLIGPFDEKMKGLIIFIFIDLVLGINAAKKLMIFTWRELAVKMQKKLIVYACWIVMFNILDKILGLPGAARNAIILVLIAMELFSASKNTAKMGYGRLAKIMENLYLTFMQGTGIPMDEINAERQKEEEKKEKPEETKEDEGGKRGGLS